MILQILKLALLAVPFFGLMLLSIWFAKYKKRPKICCGTGHCASENGSSHPKCR